MIHKIAFKKHAIKKTILLSFLLLAIHNLQAQNCVVKVNDADGIYGGDCIKGKAEGKGKYTWQNGSWYDGSWKNGYFEGQGTLHKTAIRNSDSSIELTGFWKKGTYVGKYENPFIYNLLTNNISEFNVRKLNTAEPDITIEVKTITGGALSLTHNPSIPKSKLIDVQITAGRYDQQIADEISSPVANKYIFRKASFPFEAILTFEATGTKLQTERVRVEFLESGNWFIQVKIDN